MMDVTSKQEAPPQLCGGSAVLSGVTLFCFWTGSCYIGHHVTDYMVQVLLQEEKGLCFLFPRSLAVLSVWKDRRY